MKLSLFFTCLPPLPTHFKLHEGMIFLMQNFINSVYIQWILSGKKKNAIFHARQVQSKSHTTFICIHLKT